MKLTYHTAGDIETAGGLAEWALLGNREALKGWAALVSHYLEHQSAADIDPTLNGFPSGFTEADARHCLLVLQTVFEKIHGGAEPNAAFGHKRKRGRPAKILAVPVRTAEDNERLEEIKREREAGQNLDRACESVAERYNDNPDRLRRLLKDVK